MTYWYKAWIITIIRIPLILGALTDFPVYIPSSFITVVSQTLRSLIYIYFSSAPTPAYSCPIDVFSYCSSPNISHWQECRFLVTWLKLGTLGFPKRIGRTPAHSYWKLVKLGPSRKNCENGIPFSDQHSYCGPNYTPVH
jgi:hypothetical protein